MAPTMQGGKPYELTFEIRDGYGYAYVRSEHDSLVISQTYWAEIGRRLSEAGLRKVLIVEDIDEQAPAPEDVYILVKQLPGLGFTGVQIAFVDRHSSHQELNEFGVFVASNTGLRAKAFGTDAEAIAWLKCDKRRFTTENTESTEG